MAIDVTYFQFRGFAFKPDSISFGDGETLDVNINRNGTVNTIPIKKLTATFTVVGGTDTDLVQMQNERDNNIRGLINGSAQGEDIDVFGYRVEKALLTNVNPSAPIQVDGFNIFDSIELTYESQVFV